MNWGFGSPSLAAEWPMTLIHLERTPRGLPADGERVVQGGADSVPLPKNENKGTYQVVLLGSSKDIMGS